MDNATDIRNLELEPEQWPEFPESETGAKQNRRHKKRRRPLRKNRKPSRPATHIGLRTNNHLLRIFTER